MILTVSHACHSITEELVAAGVPKDHIVLSFHPPHVRIHKGYGID
jgi:XisI protein